MRTIIAIALLVGAAGCGGSSVVETANTLDPEQVTSSLKHGSGATLAIRKTFQGGATGDTLHEAWACRSDLSQCERLAIVDTHDGPAPVWRNGGRRAQLVVRENDVVWSFTNLFHGPSSQPQRVTLVEGA